MAVDTLGHLLARHITAADVGDREAGVRASLRIPRTQTMTRCLLPMSIRATPARPRRPPLRSKGSSSKSSNGPKPKQGFVLLPEAMGSQEILCLGQPMPQPGQGFRALHHNPCRNPRYCLCRLYVETRPLTLWKVHDTLQPGFQSSDLGIASSERRRHGIGVKFLGNVLRTVRVPSVDLEQDRCLRMPLRPVRHQAPVQGRIILDDARSTPDLDAPAMHIIHKKQKSLRVLGKIANRDVLTISPNNLRNRFVCSSTNTDESFRPSAMLSIGFGRKCSP